MKNSACYWKLEKFSLRYVHYAFVDTQPYLADQLFCDHQVTVRFGEEYGKGDTDSDSKVSSLCFSYARVVRAEI